MGKIVPLALMFVDTHIRHIYFMQRLEYIDIAKGIGILMIIGLHSGFHADWMVSFEMPLFFILSGCMFNVKLSFKNFSIKKINTILIPYLFFETPKFIYDSIYALKHHISLIDAVSDSSIPTATWFLLCLFEIQIMCFFIVKIKSKFSLGFVAITALLAGYMLSYYELHNIWFVNTTITNIGYFLFGYIIKDWIRDSTHTFSLSLSLSLMSAIILFALCYGIWSIDRPYIFYRANSLGNNFFVMIATAITGTFAIVFLSRAIGHSLVLFFYGRSSLIILGMHLYFIVAIERIFSDLPCCLVFLITALLMLPMIWILKNFCPWFCGVLPLIPTVWVKSGA